MYMKKVVRLFSQFQPEHYDLTLSIDEDTMRFNGTVTIRGKKVGRPSKRITLHQNGLKITAAKITKHDKKGEMDLPISRINNQNSFHEARLHSSQMIFPGSYTLEVEFEGKITDGMTGIYPCYFKDGKTEKQLIMTQLESHFARQAFPCIDEPEAKATFNLTLRTRLGIKTLANTPTKRQAKEAGRLVTSFETTPKMSTYLLAFVIGDLQKKSGKTKDGTEINIWATTAQPASSLDFALDTAKKSVEFFEDYFGVPYPLKKLDHVACPDFSNGAMENWGLITYRERVLLAYPNETGQSMLEQIALVIAHETSHQWFGNLVTMKWWNDLWLNESFANMMEYQAVDAIHPEWKVWGMFVAQEGLGALRRDATPGVQTIKAEVTHPDEINTLFDPSIVYAKGGRLLNMLKSFIGEDAFRRGLKLYFDKHKYGNTEGADLWAALSKASNQDVAGFMNPWLEQSGFPLITIEQTGKKIKLNQQHFLDDPSKADAARLWPVPLFASDLPPKLDQKELELEAKTSDIIPINLGAKGHYLVRYATEGQRQAIQRLVASQKLAEPDRLMLLNSASMQARAGYDSYGGTLELLASYKNESAEPVWDMIGLVIGETRRFVDLDETLEPKIKALVQKLVKSQAERLGWDERKNESAADQKLRALVLGLASWSEEDASIKTALEKFEVYKSRQGSVPAELRGVVFSTAVRENANGAYEYLLNLHDKTGNSDLKADISASLTATHELKLASQLLGRIKDAKLVKPQDADRWLIYLLRNRFTKLLAWEWMEDNWDWIEQTYAEDKSYDMLPRYAAGIVNTKELASRYDKFFSPKSSEIVLKRNIEMGKAEIESRVAWLKRDLKAVQKFFN